MIWVSVLKKGSVGWGGQDSSILGEFRLPFFFQEMVERFPISVEGESALPVYVAGVLLDLLLLLEADPCDWIFWAGCWCCLYCQLQCCVLPQPFRYLSLSFLHAFHRSHLISTPTDELMHIHNISYVKTFKIAPTCFDPKIIFRELHCFLLKSHFKKIVLMFFLISMSILQVFHIYTRTCRKACRQPHGQLPP